MLGNIHDRAGLAESTIFPYKDILLRALDYYEGTRNETQLKLEDAMLTQMKETIRNSQETNNNICISTSRIANLIDVVTKYRSYLKQKHSALKRQIRYDDLGPIIQFFDDLFVK